MPSATNHIICYMPQADRPLLNLQPMRLLIRHLNCVVTCLLWAGPSEFLWDLHLPQLHLSRSATGFMHVYSCSPDSLCSRRSVCCRLPRMYTFYLFRELLRFNSILVNCKLSLLCYLCGTLRRCVLASCEVPWRLGSLSFCNYAVLTKHKWFSFFF